MNAITERLEQLDLQREYLADWAVIDCLFTGDDILREISINVHPLNFALPITFTLASPKTSDSYSVGIFHGIRSDEGKAKFKYVGELFVDLIKKHTVSRAVFVRDEKQKKYVTALLQSWGEHYCRVLNIREFGCPPVRAFVNKHCGNHGTRYSLNSSWVCTLAATQHMTIWLNEHADQLHARKEE